MEKGREKKGELFQILSVSLRARRKKGNSCFNTIPCDLRNEKGKRKASDIVICDVYSYSGSPKGRKLDHSKKKEEGKKKEGNFQ